MDQSANVRVIGRDGVSGTLLDPLPPADSDWPVRVELDTGEVVQISASMLKREGSGPLRVPLGPEDLSAAGNETVIPVLAEEVHVGRQAVQTGGVRVHRVVHEHEEIIDLPLLKEQVDVRRVTIDREVDGPLPIRREGEITIIPVVEEELVVSKRYVLREEVHVRRTVREVRHEEKVPVLSQEAVIERLDPEGRAVPVDVPPIPAGREAPARRPRRQDRGGR